MPFPTDWTLVPLQGVERVRFGMTFEEVVLLLGAPDQPLTKQWGSDARRAGWFRGGLAIHFNPDVEFIELSRDLEVRPRLADFLPLELSAASVIQRMLDAGHVWDDSDSESGFLYVFKGIQVAFWRHAVPEDEDDDDGRFFDTVAIGRPGYYT